MSEPRNLMGSVRQRGDFLSSKSSLAFVVSLEIESCSWSGKKGGRGKGQIIVTVSILNCLKLNSQDNRNYVNYFLTSAAARSARCTGNLAPYALLLRGFLLKHNL